MAGVVAFAGLGNMGWPMAANLVRAGRRVVPVDLDEGRVRAFREAVGATLEAGSVDWGEVDTVVTMLPTGREVRDVLLGPDGHPGLAPRLAAGATAVDMSSSDPVGTRQLGKDLAAYGVALVDAPVSGGVPRATDGTLTIMAGTDDPTALGRVRSLLGIMGATLFETGGLGSGHATKALNNFVAAAGFTAAAEALVLARRFGLDPEVLISVINTSTGRNFTTEAVIPDHVLGGRYATGFSLGLLTKDVGIAARLGEQLGVAHPLCEQVEEQLRLALDGLGAGADHSEAARFWDQTR